MIAVLVVNPKGGCGKTTLATNLAAAYVAGGFDTALADIDRQKSALDWLDRRPWDRPAVLGLDWSKKVGRPPSGTQRLIMDSAAALTRGHFRELLALADTVVLPVLPSAFDRAAVRRFLRRVEDLKDIRKNRKPVGIVVNQARARTRASAAMEEFLAELDHPVVARVRSRALYPDLAEAGLGVFERANRVARAAQEEWSPLLTYIETTEF